MGHESCECAETKRLERGVRFPRGTTVALLGVRFVRAHRFLRVFVVLSPKAMTSVVTSSWKGPGRSLPRTTKGRRDEGLDGTESCEFAERSASKGATRRAATTVALLGVRFVRAHRFLRVFVVLSPKAMTSTSRERARWDTSRVSLLKRSASKGARLPTGRAATTVALLGVRFVRAHRFLRVFVVLSPKAMTSVVTSSWKGPGRSLPRTTKARRGGGFDGQVSADGARLPGGSAHTRTFARLTP
jgi:hypothetical protein